MADRGGCRRARVPSAMTTCRRRHSSKCLQPEALGSFSRLLMLASRWQVCAGAFCEDHLPSAAQLTVHCARFQALGQAQPKQVHDSFTVHPTGFALRSLWPAELSRLEIQVLWDRLTPRERRTRLASQHAVAHSLVFTQFACLFFPSVLSLWMTLQQERHCSTARVWHARST